MKIHRIDLPNIGPSKPSNSTVKGADFARVLEETLAKDKVQHTEAPRVSTFSEVPKGLYQKAQEVLHLLEGLTQASTEETLHRLEVESRALTQALAGLPHSSGKHLLEEVALLATVEATKCKSGRYS